MGSILDLPLCVVTFLIFGFNLFINSYVGSGGERFGLNFSAIGEVSRQFETDITPAGWAFSIWGLIYLWQILLQIYLGLTILMRGTTTSSALRFVKTPPFPYLSVFYTVYIINLLATIGWVFTWCLGYVNYATPFITMTPICLWFALGIALKGSTAEKQDPSREGIDKRTSKALTIALVHNGIGLYATWTTIATLINTVIALSYYAVVAMPTACIIALSILSAAVSAWFVVDVALLQATTRYLLTPYCVLAFALSASLAKNWDGGPVSIFTAVLLAAGAAMLVMKFVLIVVIMSCKDGVSVDKPSVTLSHMVSDKQALVM